MSERSLSSVKTGFLPVHVELPFTRERLLQASKEELTAIAEADPDGCAVYLPSARERPGLSLVQTAKFARQFSIVRLGFRGLTHELGLLRLSLRQQPALNGLHLDSVTRTGIADSGAARRSLDRRLWVVILNLSDEHERTLRYSKQSPDALEFIDSGGLLTCSDFDEDQVGEITINPRTREKVFGASFCASETPHGAKEYAGGHFIARYVKVENI